MTDTPDINALLPCPFCGSDNLGSGGDDKIVGVWCKDCQANGPNHYGRGEWNTRATPPITAADVEAARAEERDALIAAAEMLLPKDMGEIQDAGRDYCAGVRDTVNAIRARGDST